MSSPDEAGYVVIPGDEWATHPWLSLLESGSDLDGDAAFFVTGTSATDTAALRLVVIQYRIPGREWQDATPADGAVFPSRSWAKATAGWYRPDRAYLSPAEYEATEYRALVPKGSA
jgi:hypothetical protein